MEKRWRVGVIRVVTQHDPVLMKLHGELIERYFPMLETESRCIPDQPMGIHDPESKAVAIPKILETAKLFSGIDVLVVSCADDPGVTELRAEMDIPVVGAGSSVAAIARRCGGRAGILGITDYVPDPYVEILGEGLLNLGRPVGVSSTLDLMTPDGEASVFAHAVKLREAGAGSIALACTGLSTIGASARLERHCGVPVIDPVMAEGLFAFYECRRRHPIK